MIITRIWKQQGGRYFCISSKNAQKKWKDHFFTRKQFGDVEEFIRENSDKDLYFCPHGFTEPRRLKEYSVPPNLLWSDMDAADPRTIKIKPTIAIESSPGRFVGLWLLEKGQRTIEEIQSINRRLSKLIGGDPTGWDFSQVLRVPGTTNYKYTTLPRVRIMWSDGESFTVDEIERQLPREAPTDDVTIEGDASRVYKLWEKRMPAWLRRELMRKRTPAAGNRSEMMFKIACELVELGMSRDEVLLLLQMTPWNKYGGRRDEGKRLYDLWDRAINKKGAAIVVGETDDGEYRYLARSMADIEARDIEWIWYGFLARGEITLLSGDPEAGKSFIAQNIAGAICRGAALPSHVKDPPAPVQGRVAYFDIENSPDTVTKKRLMWQRYPLEAQSNFYQEEMPFSINDEEELGKVIDALERIKPTLIVFDTLNTYIGKTDTNAGAETQQTAIKFKELARRFNCSVLILRHLTKSARDKAMYRGAGSIALTGVARIEILAGHHPEEQDLRLMAQAKNNICAKPPALTYEIRSAGTKDDRDRAVFEWGEFDGSMNAEHIVAAPKEKDTTERDTAKQLLLETLADGRIEASRVEAMAEARAISKRTLYRAKKELNVVSETKGFGRNRETWWSLPENLDVV